MTMFGSTNRTLPITFSSSRARIRSFRSFFSSDFGFCRRDSDRVSKDYATCSHPLVQTGSMPHDVKISSQSDSVGRDRS